MDLEEIDRLWARHPAWRLMRARNAPLVLSFLGRYFIEDNRGAVAAGQLTSALDDELFAVHRVDPDRYPASPESYLSDWSGPEAAWLRSFYPTGSEEVHYEATPALQKAYGWIESLRSRAFVGTESRLQMVIDLLRQIVRGSDVDPESRVAELERRRDAIEVELEAARAGRFEVMGDTAVRERYQQFAFTSRELLSDFREVEENFRMLDRSTRERIAGWDGGKGDLLADLVTNRSDISSSDQGRSFRAFYDLILSENGQDELSGLLQTVQAMPELTPDRRLRTVHHDWADAAERTQQTVRNLSEQLRRFLEDHVWVENRRVMDLVRAVEASAIAVREAPPTDTGLIVDLPGISIALPLERPLYDPQPPVAVNSMPSPDALDPAELESLFAQRFVDTNRLVENIRSLVPPRTSAALEDIIAMYPLEEGIAELLGYLALDDDGILLEVQSAVGESASVSGDEAESDEAESDEVEIDYTDLSGTPRRVRMHRVMVTRQ